MSAVTTLLREGLLDGRAVALAGDERGATAAALRALGGEVRALPAALADDDASDAVGRVDALVVEAAAGFAAGLVDGAARVWSAVRSVANAAWIEPGEPGGRIVLVAPAPGAAPDAEAARAALENLARTLSIEWARYGIRISAVTPGDATGAADVSALVAYLVSPAGEYFSGCRLDLDPGP